MIIIIIIITIITVVTIIINAIFIAIFISIAITIVITIARVTKTYVIYNVVIILIAIRKVLLGDYKSTLLNKGYNYYSELL